MYQNCDAIPPAWLVTSKIFCKQWQWLLFISTLKPWIEHSWRSNLVFPLSLKLVSDPNYQVKAVYTYETRRTEEKYCNRLYKFFWWCLWPKAIFEISMYFWTNSSLLKNLRQILSFINRMMLFCLMTVTVNQISQLPSHLCCCPQPAAVVVDGCCF